MEVLGPVLVTGATRGIGRAVADRLAAGGCAVIGLARRDPDDDFPGEFLPCDLLDREATAATLRGVSERHAVAGLVNNAGLNHVEPIGEVDLAHFDEVVEINLRAAIQCAQAVLPSMRARGYGRIVNVSSRGALGRHGRTSYGAAKAGVVGMSRTWALELAPEGVTVNVVSPGPIATRMFLTNNAGRVEEFTRGVPMGRLGEPDEVAAVVHFLLSREASYVTGQLLHACGGASVGSAPL